MPIVTGRRFLKIVRKTRDEHGNLVDTVTKVYDKKVIDEYCRRRESEGLRTRQKRPRNKPAAPLTAEEEAQRRDLRRHREHERRQKRRESHAGTLASSQGTSAPASGKSALAKGRKATELVCSACGKVGHIRTNKSCTMYGKAGPSRKDGDVSKMLEKGASRKRKLKNEDTDGEPPSARKKREKEPVTRRESVEELVSSVRTNRRMKTPQGVLSTILEQVLTSLFAIPNVCLLTPTPPHTMPIFSNMSSLRSSTTQLIQSWCRITET